MDRTTWLAVLAGASLAAGAVAILTYVGLRGRRSVVHETPLGRLRIPLKQLEEAVARLGRRLPGVARLRVRMSRRKGGLQVAMKVRLKPETTANAVLDSLRHLSVSALESMLGQGPEAVRLDVTAPDTRVARPRERVDLTS